MTGIGAFEPDDFALARALVRDPASASTIFSSSAADAAVALTGSSCTAYTVPSGMSALPSRSRRFPRRPAVFSSWIVSPAASAGCHSEPFAG
jgi:hypothetical protein